MNTLFRQRVTKWSGWPRGVPFPLRRRAGAAGPLSFRSHQWAPRNVRHSQGRCKYRGTQSPSKHWLCWLAGRVQGEGPRTKGKWETTKIAVTSFSTASTGTGRLSAPEAGTPGTQAVFTGPSWAARFPGLFVLLKEVHFPNTMPPPSPDPGSRQGRQPGADLPSAPLPPAFVWRCPDLPVCFSIFSDFDATRSWLRGTKGIHANPRGAFPLLLFVYEAGRPAFWPERLAVECHQSLKTQPPRPRGSVRKICPQLFRLVYPSLLWRLRKS